MTEAVPSGEITILTPGLCTLVVDRGRPSTRSLGVPVGGAADGWSLAVGNALVGNPPDAAALEINLAGPTLVADCSIAAVVYGSGVEVFTDQRSLVSGKTFTLNPGEILTIASVRSRARAYLCVQGGLNAGSILGSCSGLAPLQKGERIRCRPGTIQARFLTMPAATTPDRLAVVWGSHAEWFDCEAFLSQSWEISRLSNRMGLRLLGQPLPGPQRELVSEPVCPGTVQVTRDGQCIILGVDGQTIGGYPRIAHVISADLDRVGQLRPGQKIRFESVSPAEAEQRFLSRRKQLQSLLSHLEVGSIWSSRPE